MIFSLFSLKFLHICFFIFSIFLGGTLNAARPSSLYSPIFLPCFGVSCDSRFAPTSSHVSAPSKLPMVTSKSEFADFLHHAVSLWKSRDFFACVMIFISWLDMSSYFEANASAFLSSSSVIEG